MNVLLDITNHTVFIWLAQSCDPGALFSAPCLWAAVIILNLPGIQTGMQQGLGWDVLQDVPIWTWMGQDTHSHAGLGVSPAEPKENAAPGWSQGLATPAISPGVFSYSDGVH